LRPDLQKIDRIVTECISSPAHYAGVIDGEEGVQAVLLAYVMPNFWAERSVANIVLWAGQGGAWLMRDFLRWLSGRRGIRLAGVSPDLDDWDNRTTELLLSLGFEATGGDLVKYN